MYRLCGCSSPHTNEIGRTLVPTSRIGTTRFLSESLPQEDHRLTGKIKNFLMAPNRNLQSAATRVAHQKYGPFKETMKQNSHDPPFGSPRF